MEDTLFPFFWEPPDPHANRGLNFMLKIYRVQNMTLEPGEGRGTEGNQILKYLCRSLR